VIGRVEWEREEGGERKESEFRSTRVCFWEVSVETGGGPIAKVKMVSFWELHMKNGKIGSISKRGSRGVAARPIHRTIGVRISIGEDVNGGVY